MVLNSGGAARLPLAVAVILFLATSPRVFAGVLALGQPTVENGQYTFPVALEGADNQVTALDFRVQFDPTVFLPVSVVPGDAALAGNKVVNANYAAPGQYVVVMMGFNQTAVPGGHVVSVVLQRTGGETESPTSQVSISDPTLSRADGTELPAEGSSVAVTTGSGKPQSSEGEDSSAAEGEDTPNGTETPTAETPKPASAPAARPTAGGTPAASQAGPPARPTMFAAGRPNAANGDAPAEPQNVAPDGGAVKPGGMPVVQGTQVPLPGPNAKVAGSTGSTLAGQSVHTMPAAASADSPPAAAKTIATTVESSRTEPSRPASASAKVVVGGAAESQGNELLQLLLIAGVGAVVLVIAGVLLKKFSNR